MVDIGYQLEDFTVKTEAGVDFTLADLKGSPTVLYFYQKQNLCAETCAERFEAV